MDGAHMMMGGTCVGPGSHTPHTPTLMILLYTLKHMKNFLRVFGGSIISLLKGEGGALYPS